ncbi:hypothetical protein [Sulfitobacter sp. PS-8MA]|uniref:hypothetical protein n=1 Tax=Sulfitobacter sp. PS-8MA TaxID=3237707 RepID=UPI0034C62B84
MTETAPERIWAQDAQPDECNYTGGGWWDDECGNTQYPHMVEYVRADLLDEAVKAAYLAGFTASGEGYNGEYPFQQYGKNPENDADWVKDRDATLAKLRIKT